MSKQTAVKLLIQEIEKDQTIKAKSKSEWNEIFEQAKQMEKEQLEDAYLAGEAKDEQYYKETYERENNKH